MTERKYRVVHCGTGATGAFGVRGIVHRADLELVGHLVFDPAKVHARASYQEPNLLSEGFDWVLVNGRSVREKGAHTAARPGRLLRRAEKS